jgi:hypothetical protein
LKVAQSDAVALFEGLGGLFIVLREFCDSAVLDVFSGRRSPYLLKLVGVLDDVPDLYEVFLEIDGELGRNSPILQELLGRGSKSPDVLAATHSPDWEVSLVQRDVGSLFEDLDAVLLMHSMHVAAGWS